MAQEDVVEAARQQGGGESSRPVDGICSGTAVVAARELVRRRRLQWARGPIVSVSATSADIDSVHADQMWATTHVAASLSGPAWSVDVDAVERRRIVRGWTRLELAGVAHVDPKTLRDFLGRRRRPNFGTVQAICTALGLTLADVIRFP